MVTTTTSKIEKQFVLTDGLTSSLMDNRPKEHTWIITDIQILDVSDHHVLTQIMFGPLVLVKTPCVVIPPLQKTERVLTASETMSSRSKTPSTAPEGSDGVCNALEIARGTKVALNTARKLIANMVMSSTKKTLTWTRTDIGNAEPASVSGCGGPRP